MQLGEGKIDLRGLNETDRQIEEGEKLLRDLGIEIGIPKEVSKPRKVAKVTNILDPLLKLKNKR